MSLLLHRNPDGTTTGRNDATGFTVTNADEEEVKRLLYEDAGWEYTPPPPPVPPGFHRFSLVHDEFRAAGFGDERYAGLRARPPEGCVPVDRGCFALECERPGRTLLDAVAGTVAEIRREHGLVMNSLGVEKPQERSDADHENGYAAKTVAHLVLMAAHRARVLGYGRRDVVRLLDAAGVE
ncbi:hypothetical protein [Streptomyces griseomycini]|uniref:Uncharacterized protein n=1 Tax=Streptomyces griseomycini TaxID=66895 RepID=A0A7W7PUY4_9ACTN|nr:hypothetical protein [Streptomyces griseomycini]MBB4901749.1 hypothetical protein [Streptomyces griseomycini]GGQ30539.1 hypothetical protein GCM10010266_62210 [Streptomyces griseomycini]GGR50360.1 hypothetical protein GCM10015536_65010 [Streptomyces griseomycini]